MSIRKQQWLLIGGGILLFGLIYLFGRFTPSAGDKKPAAKGEVSAGISLKEILEIAKKELSPEQQGYVSQLEAGIVRGDVKEQHIKVYRQLSSFWRDSAHLLLPATYYEGAAAKLENSEKSLTFAAHNFLDGLRRQTDPRLKTWMALQAKELFEKARTINPDNDSTKVGLGSCYLLGGISQNPMEGIKLIREVADKDPSNAYAQFMLGLGGMESGQFDKAIERLNKVVELQPQNLEAVLTLAEAYERQGDKANAIKWYESSKKFFANEPKILQEIDQRIHLLKQ